MNTLKTILTSVTSFFLALIFSLIPMKEDALLLSVETPVTTVSTEIVLVYENKTDRSVSFCEDQYYAERKTATGWVAEPRLNLEFSREILTVIQPHSEHRYTIKVSEPLDAGEYRISQTYSVETYSLRQTFAGVGGSHTVTAEFTVS